MTAPLIDARKWAMETLHEEWKQDLSEPEKNKIQASTRELHRNVAHERLREAIIDLRELVAVSELVLQRKIRNTSVFMWLNARMLSSEAELLTLARDYNVQLFERSLENAKADDSLRLHHYVCLTNHSLGQRNVCEDE